MNIIYMLKELLIMFKICKNCNIEIDIKNGKVCAKCISSKRKEYMKKYYINNSNHIKENVKVYYDENRDKILEYKKSINKNNDKYEN